VNNIVIEALQAGDLPHDLRPQEVTMSLIAITIGCHVVVAQPELLMLCGVNNPIESMRRQQEAVCDGWGWKPLLADWDYQATQRRIRDEIFPEAVWLNEEA
jgi:hypothetical protein